MRVIFNVHKYSLSWIPKIIIKFSLKMMVRWQKLAPITDSASVGNQNVFSIFWYPFSPADGIDDCLTIPLCFFDSKLLNSNRLSQSYN